MTALSIRQTCPCGATFESNGSEMVSQTLAQEAFIRAHEQCCTLIREKRVADREYVTADEMREAVKSLETGDEIIGTTEHGDKVYGR